MPPFVKMSELARLSGVPSPTIKHYLNEGLLEIAHKTGKNMAYYDAALVPRIQRIKELQRTRFLPLRVIKRVLDDAELSPDETASAAIARVLSDAAPTERRTKAQLESAGLAKSDLDMLVSIGAIRVEGDGEGAAFTGDDLELLRVLGASRRAGITNEMLPPAILGEYVTAIQALVRAELRLFREGVLPKAGKDLGEITEAATVLSERLVVLVRRKLLLPTLRSLASEAEPRPRSAGKGKRKPR